MSCPSAERSKPQSPDAAGIPPRSLTSLPGGSLASGAKKCSEMRLVTSAVRIASNSKGMWGPGRKVTGNRGTRGLGLQRPPRRAQWSPPGSTRCAGLDLPPRARTGFDLDLDLATSRSGSLAAHLGPRTGPGLGAQRALLLLGESAWTSRELAGGGDEPGRPGA